MARRVELVYDDVQCIPKPSLLGRLKNALALGPIAGLGHVLFIVMDYIMLFIYEWMSPKEKIDIAADFEYDIYK